MNDEQLIWERYKFSVLFEKTLDIPSADSISQEEKEYIYSLLSPYELSQLGTSVKGQTSPTEYVPKEDWPRLRKLLVMRSMGDNKLLTDPTLTAYTPGETWHLLHHPTVVEWHNKIINHTIPDNYDTVIFVPCAKTKPWGINTCGRSRPYKDYNQIRKEYGNVYFVTISEPLAIVPQDMWEDFPQYDNPGLFIQSKMRSDLSTQEWKTLFKDRGLNKYMLIPFDPSMYDKCVAKLGSIINQFVTNIHKRNPNLKMLSFVKDLGDERSHSDMLSHIDSKIQDSIAKYTKKEASGRGSLNRPYPWIKSKLDEK
jgi:hypothetical protein